MHYELWDTRTANLIGLYDTEDEALVDVEQALADGWDSDRLALGLEPDEDEDIDDDALGPALSGPALAARATGREAPESDLRRRLA